MKRFCGFSLLCCTMLTVCAAAALAQGTPGTFQARSAGPTIFLTGPNGKRSTLSYSANAGWRLRSWAAEGRAAAGGSPEQPLTVYLDGPTGYAFIYVLAEGWKFVGRIDDTGD
jgi:hypothetical protein